MKLLRHLILVLLTVLLLPVQERSTVHAQQHAGIHILKANPSSPYLHATIHKFKRRPVGLNDSHVQVCTVFSFHLRDRFVYVDGIRNGYHCNPYLSVPKPLRSWRGPPTA
ncbi:hypothetical protein [Chitinophaga solisilvae]|uniref:Uncharacterized protein n=1 Tax=Chitinophaga solisilvae TaxID=1233460 RepID=A0A9Q5GSI5_9BACT|nr:hypothetical protein [Chitinophaga solisilvae]NSL86614.1 hypothetical protein [Chitinophaga solisilvae]